MYNCEFSASIYICDVTNSFKNHIEIYLILFFLPLFFGINAWSLEQPFLIIFGHLSFQGWQSLKFRKKKKKKTVQSKEFVLPLTSKGQHTVCRQVADSDGLTVIYGSSPPPPLPPKKSINQRLVLDLITGWISVSCLSNFLFKVQGNILVQLKQLEFATDHLLPFTLLEKRFYLILLTRTRKNNIQKIARWANINRLAFFDYFISF